MSSTGAIPRTKKPIKPQKSSLATPVLKTLHHDAQILVGQDATEPLDVKMLTVSSNGVQTRVPALHKSWCSGRQLILFCAPPREELDVPGALDAWLEQGDFYLQDLQWMLELSHHRFWSELVYVRKIHDCLESYLTNAPRWYDNFYEGSQHKQTIEPVMADIHRHVLLVHLRIATYKESKTCTINPAAFGELLYNNYIVDMCQLLDLAALYCPSNTALLNKMFTNIFVHQPRYNDDLLSVVTSIVTALDNIEQQLGVSDSSVPLSLKAAPSTPELSELRACVLYLLDTCYTLHNLVQVYPPVAAVCHTKDLHVRLAVCYERVMPVLGQALGEYLQQEEDCVPQVLHLLHLCRTTCLAAYRQILHTVALEPLQQEGVTSQEVSTCLEQYLHVVSSCLAEKTFIADYHTSYSFSKDTTLFKDRSSDATSLEFIEDAVRTVLAEVGVDEHQPETHTPSLTNGHTATDTTVGDKSGMNEYVSSGSTEVDPLQLAEQVSTVTDLMPDLGAGFVTECLRHYQYNSEAVINALLEDSLPATLSSLDRALATSDHPASAAQQSVSQRSVSPTQHSTPAVGDDDYCDTGYYDAYEQGLDEAKLSVMSRSNVYNDDEFDVFSDRQQNISVKNVHRGKRNKGIVEQDERVKQRVIAIGHEYAVRQGHSIYEDDTDVHYEMENKYMTAEEAERLRLIPYADYNDEYDDTYDDNEAGNVDAKAERSLRSKPGMAGRGALNRGDSPEEEEKHTSNGPTPLPAEEGEEAFGRRRGLRKGIGGVNFLLQLREHGGMTTASSVPKRDRNLPASHEANNNKHKRNTRFLPRGFHKEHHKPEFVNSCKEGGGEDEEGEEEEQQEGEGAPRLSFTPFCEDPSVLRERQLQRYAARDNARNRGGNHGRRQTGATPAPQQIPANGFDGRADTDSYRGGTPAPEAAAGGGVPTRDNDGSWPRRPKTQHTANSGKSWRQAGNDDETRGSRGGKYKEGSSTHGSAQDPNFRRKMENKNKARKQAAQNKFNRNNDT